MDLVGTEKQRIAFTTPATELLYGGAKGGGKSFFLRLSALRWALEVPGIQVFLFRRTLADLRRNHMEGPKSFPVMLREHIASGHVKYSTQHNQYEFWNGSIIHLCYCESERDVENYQGAEIHVLMPDEMTHYTEYQYRYLRGQVRLAGLKVPAQYRSRLPRIEGGSNPGSVGHAWVKRTFILPRPALEVWRAPPEEGGMLRQFVPAKLSDNPYLSQDDPDYENRLRGMGNDDLVKAMLDGNWDIVAGQALEKLNREVHCIEPFTPPDDWLKFRSLDWGSSKPFSCGLWCVSNGNALPDGRVYPRGSIIRYDEVYGWAGKADEGLRMEVAEVAQEILKRSKGRFAYTAADPSMWKVDGGPSHAEIMLRHGLVLRKADNSRHAGYLEVRGRVAGGLEGPMLYATKNCHAGFWRTMPDLIMDRADPEDVDTDQEDHCFDDVRYACMSRPWLKVEEAKTKAPDRWLRLFDERDEADSWKTA